MKSQAVNLIIGGGQAGARAAEGMITAGFAGRIVLIGAECHPPYERPPLSKEVLLDDSARTEAPQTLPADFYRAHDMDLRLGDAVVSIDRVRQRVLLASGSSLPYDKLMLATGSRLRRLDIEGAHHENVLYLRTFDDSLAIRSRLTADASVLIVGGGFIGLEIAACALRKGCRVSVVEAGSCLLGRIRCPAVSTYVAQYHRTLGADVKLGVKPIRFEGASRAESIILSNEERLDIDLAVVGVGIDPETSLAAEAGLEVDNGILTDAFGVTSDANIFAAGDVTRHFNPLLGRRIRLESWENAQLQAFAAGQSMAGRPTVYAEVPWLWSNQGELNLQVAGCPDHVSDVVLRGDAALGDFAAFQFDGKNLAGAITVNRGREMPLIRRMFNSQRIFSPDDVANPSMSLKKILA